MIKPRIIVFVCLIVILFFIAYVVYVMLDIPQPNPEEQETINRIEKLGGYCSHPSWARKRRSNKFITGVSLSGCNISDKDIAELNLDKLQRLQSIDLSCNPEITDATFKILLRIKTLGYVNCVHTGMTQEAYLRFLDLQPRIPVPYD